MNTLLLITISIVLVIALIIIIYRVNWKKETEDMRDLFSSKSEDTLSPDIKEDGYDY